MRAELKGLQVFHDKSILMVDEFVPDDPASFGVGVTALIGPASEPGEEIFQFIVCTPQWLASESFEKGFRWGRNHLFLTSWSAPVVLRVFNDLCRHAEGSDWGEVAMKLSRYGYWEFEDYRELT